MKIVVIGGSGLIGTKLVKLLRERGHEALAASPSSGVNTITGEGLAEALAGAQVVVDLANAPSWEDNAVLEFFLPGTFGSSCCGQASSGPGGIRPTKPDRASPSCPAPPPRQGQRQRDEAGQAPRGVRGGRGRDGTDDPIRELRSLSTPIDLPAGASCAGRRLQEEEGSEGGTIQSELTRFFDCTV